MIQHLGWKELCKFASACAHYRGKLKEWQLPAYKTFSLDSVQECKKESWRPRLKDGNSKLIMAMAGCSLVQTMAQELDLTRLRSDIVAEISNTSILLAFHSLEKLVLPDVA